MRQSQFLEVVDRDEAERRFHSALDLSPLGTEAIPLATALGRVLAADIASSIDVPGFTRSNVDGFAVRAADTFGCAEESPGTLELAGETVATGIFPRHTVAAGTATGIATGGVLPRGADAVVMVEHTTLDTDGKRLRIHRPVAPGSHLSQAGSDIARGQTVLRAGTLLTSRDTGVIAALGQAELSVHRRPRVAILSTGDELVAPGAELAPAQIHDANATILADAVRELGCIAVPLGIVADDEQQVEQALRQGLADADVVLLSGGTSKGAGDVNAAVVHRLPPPGVLAHGVALKPGKPICLAAAGNKPVVILPGFPTSAVFTFHEFVAPVLRAFGGLPPLRHGRCRAVLPARINSATGRTEYVLVGLVQPSPGAQGAAGSADGTAATGAASLPVAVPMGKGSGSVTAFGAADGFIAIPRNTEYVEAGEPVEVTLLGRDLQPADLVIQGSHCLGLDRILESLRRRGFTARFLAVGSSAGLQAVARGHADVAGIHLLDTATGEYNRSFLPQGVTLLQGYGRLQGIVFRQDDTRFAGGDARAAVTGALAAGEACVLINRNAGSGTRVLIDSLLGEARPPGFTAEARSHHAVAAAVSQGRADWGVAIDTVARLHGLGFLPLTEERFDFAVAENRIQRQAVGAFAEVLADADTRRELQTMGFSTG